MNTLEIQRKIQEEDNRLSNILEEENDYLVFLKNFLENNNFSGIYNIENINIPDFFISYMLYKCKNLTYEKIKEIVNKSRDIFKEENLLENFEDSLGKIFDIATTDMYDTYMELAFTNNTIIRFMKFLANKDFKEDLDLITLIHDYPEEAEETVSLIYSIIGLKRHNITIQLATGIDLNAKENRKYKRHNKQGIDTSEFDACINGFIEYCTRLVDLEKGRKKQTKKELIALRKVSFWVNSLETKKEKININEEISKIGNEQLRCFILKQLYSHNLSICEKRQDEYQKLLKNSKNNYKRILRKHHIDIEDCEIDFVIDADDMDDCLNILEKLNITNTDTIIQILKTTTKERVETLNSYIGSGYLEKSVLINYPSLFNCKEGNSLFDNLDSNIVLLKQKNISTTIIGSMNSIILFDTRHLKKNLEILDSYGYTPFLKNSSSYSFLLSNDLEQKLNIMIELGCSSNLETDLSLLGYSKDDYKKFTILKEINLLPVENSELEAVLNKQFGKDDTNLDDYILDMRNFADFEDDDTFSKDEFLQRLDDYDAEKSDLRCYHFKDVLISRTKVREGLNRIISDNLTTSEQFEIVTKDKILNSEEYQVIKSLLDSKKAVESPMVKIK